MGCAQGTDVWVRGPASRQGGQYKRSALHWASAKGLAGTVAQLLALGADATLTDTRWNGDTALMLACANKQEAAAGELMEATKRAGALDLQVGHEAWVLRACVV